MCILVVYVRINVQPILRWSPRKEPATRALRDENLTCYQIYAVLTKSGLVLKCYETTARALILA